MDETFRLNGFTCCRQCAHHQSCLLQWVRGERGLSDHCCSLCAHASACYETISPEKRVDDDPMSVKISEEDQMALDLIVHAYICCPGCEAYDTCPSRIKATVSSRPSRCCPACSSLRACHKAFRRQAVAN